MTMTTHNPRTDLITGLRDLADFLDTNPDVPTSNGSVEVFYFPSRSSDDQMCAEVDEIARYLGAEIDPANIPHGHYVTGISFGLASYRAVAILAEARAEKTVDAASLEGQPHAASDAA
jgi:hypothetical protein